VKQILIIAIIFMNSAVLFAGDIIRLNMDESRSLDLTSLTEIQPVSEQSNKIFQTSGGDFVINVEEDGPHGGSFCIKDIKGKVLNEWHKIVDPDKEFIGYADKNLNYALMVKREQDQNHPELIMVWELDNMDTTYALENSSLGNIESLYLHDSGQLFIKNENGLFSIEGFNRQSNSLTLLPATIVPGDHK